MSNLVTTNHEKCDVSYVRGLSNYFLFLVCSNTKSNREFRESQYLVCEDTIPIKEAVNKTMPKDSGPMMKMYRNKDFRLIKLMRQ